MKEFIVPDDGFIVKTEMGRPILEVSIEDEGNFVRLFGADGEPKLQLATHGDSGALIVGSPDGSGIVISAAEGVSELQMMNSGKHIALAIDKEHSELRFVNEANALTNKLYVDDNGGQIGLSDHQGTLSLSAGVGSGAQGGLLHVMNKSGNTVAALDSDGAITLLDSDGGIRIVIGLKGDRHIQLVDEDGHITWSTIAQPRL